MPAPLRGARDRQDLVREDRAQLGEGRSDLGGDDGAQRAGEALAVGGRPAGVERREAREGLEQRPGVVRQGEHAVEDGHDAGDRRGAGDPAVARADAEGRAWRRVASAIARHRATIASPSAGVVSGW